MSVQRLSEIVREKDAVLWVGAGFSLYAGMPNANTLRDIIINSCHEGEKIYFENKSLAEVADTFIDLRNGSRNELHKLLQSVIDIEPKSIWAHELIAEIPQIDLIITTNYDYLFEEAYGREIASIVSNSDLSLANKRTSLYKIHGDIKWPESVVITGGDYTEFFRNQDKPLWNKVKTLLAEKTIIFLGYSLSDQNINYLFDNVLKDIGSMRKESYLVAPSIPDHTQRNLSKKGIHYINMKGEDFISELHSEIKANLLQDVIDNKVNGDLGLKILNNYGLNATILTNSESSMIKSLGSTDNEKKMKLNITFDDINFFRLLDESPTDAFEISGENIKGITSNFEGIIIPQRGKVSSLKIIPLPSKEMIVDIFFRQEDILLANVHAKVFDGYSSTILTFSHDLAEFAIDFDNNLFNFRLKEFKRLKDLEEIIEFLIHLVSGEEPLVIYIKDSLGSNLKGVGEEIEFIQMHPQENINIKEELISIHQIVNLLKKIQRHYRVVFRDFHLNLNEDSLRTINILELHMDKKTQEIEKLFFNIDDIKFIKDVSNRDEYVAELIERQEPMFFESKESITSVNLLNQVIVVNDELIVKCDDAIMVHPNETTLHEQKTNYAIEIRGVKNKILMGFMNSSNK